MGLLGARLGFNRSFDDQHQEPTPSTPMSRLPRRHQGLSRLRRPQIAILADSDISRMSLPSSSGAKCWRFIPRRDVLQVPLLHDLIDRPTQMFGSCALESCAVQRCSIVRLVPLRRFVNSLSSSTVLRPGPSLGSTDHPVTDSCAVFGGVQNGYIID